jgi:hypothetical protein
MFAVGIRSDKRFVSFIVCPDHPVEYRKAISLISEVSEGKTEKVIGVVEGTWRGVYNNNVPYTGTVCRVNSNGCI